MADEVVSHAFSHGFHPQHNQRLLPIGLKRSADLMATPSATATKQRSSASTAATALTRRWISAPSPASTTRWKT
jgi:hypothetical protein